MSEHKCKITCVRHKWLNEEMQMRNKNLMKSGLNILLFYVFIVVISAVCLRSKYVWEIVSLLDKVAVRYLNGIM
jgi:hypothetical protein